MNVEEKVSLVFGDKKCDDDSLIQASRIELFDIRISETGFVIFIQEFPRFSFDSSKWLTFHLIKNIVRDRWHDLYPQHWDLVVDFLFVKCVEEKTYQMLTEKSAIELANAQATIIMKSFPEIWDNFWENIASFPLIIQLRFVESLCYIGSFPAPPVVYPYIKKLHCFSDDILNVIFTGIGSYPMALSALGYFSKWTNVTWFEYSERLESFLYCLNIPNFVGQSLDVISIILDSFPSMIDRIISLFEIENYVSTLVEHESLEDFVTNYAKMIASLGYATLSMDSSRTYYIHAFDLLRLNNDDVTNSIVSYLDTYTSLFNEYSSELFQIVIEKLISHFDTNVFPESYIIGRLTHLAYTCLVSQEGEILDILSSLMECGYENISLLSSIIKIVHDCITYGYTFSSMESIIQFTIPILSSYDQIESNQISILVVILELALIIDCDASFNEFIVQTFNCIFNLYVMNRENTDIQKHCVSSLELFIYKYHKYINFSNEHIKTLLESSLIENCQILAVIINNLDQHSSSFYLQMALSTTQQASTLTFLSFLSKVKIEDPVLREDLKSFLLDLYNSGQQPIEMQSLIIISLSSIWLNGFDILYGILNEIPLKCELINAFCIAFKRYSLYINQLKIQGIDDQINLGKYSECILKIFDLFDEYMDNFWASAPIESEEHPIVLMISNVFKLLSSSMNYFDTDDLKEMLFRDTQDILARFYTNHTLFLRTIEFLSSAAEYFPSQIISTLTSATLYCVFAPTYDPNNPKWFVLTKSIIRFHHKLHKKIPDSFQREFIQATLNKNCEATAAIDYIEALKKFDNKESVKEGMELALEFFSDLVI